MARETIGKIRCPITGADADIRQAARGKYPLYYYSQQSGIIHGKTPEFEGYIQKNGVFFGNEEAATPEPKEPGGFLDMIFGGDDD